MTLGISTLAFTGLSKEEIVKIAKQEGYILEFSSSFRYQSGMVDFFNSLDIPRFAHNYFPAPKKPFVLNLGSINDEIRNNSITHCMQGLEMSQKCGAPFFSAHAGFCIDPNPDDLGKQLHVNIEINRQRNWKLFVESINIILLEAERLGVSFLIENNVTAKFNLRRDNQQALFCSHPEELISLVNHINNSKRFGLLLDTAHLKVSSLSLKFDMDKAVESLRPFVRYIHHSDNNGHRDTNDPINENYWFLKHMKDFKDCTHILEVKKQQKDSIEQQLQLLHEYTK